MCWCVVCGEAAMNTYTRTTKLRERRCFDRLFALHPTLEHFFGTTMTAAAETDASQPSVEERARQLYRGVALAPMVRASTTPLRALALQYGADFVYTEELVDRSLSDTIRQVNDEMKTIDYLRNTSKLSAKQQRKLEKSNIAPLLLRIDPALERGKLVCQLGTGEPNLALQAAMHVYQDVDAIDINMGCPKKFSVSGGMGSALLSDPDRACSIISTLRGALPNTPVSAKIRLLKDTPATLDFCESLINAGVNALAIHGRRVGDDAIHPAHWDELKETVKILRSKHASIPILVNGDFYTRTEWMDFIQETGASGVLLARPALYNTSIVRKPTDSSLPISTYGYDSPLLLDKTTVVQDYLKHCLHYNTHFKNSKYVVCEMMQNRRTPIPRVQFLPQTFPGGQTIKMVCDCKSLEAICDVWNVSSDTGVTKEVAAPAGEHRYEDSYFLNDNKTTKPLQSKDDAVDVRDAKRARLEEPLVYNGERSS